MTRVFVVDPRALLFVSNIAVCLSVCLMKGLPVLVVHQRHAERVGGHRREVAARYAVAHPVLPPHGGQGENNGLPRAAWWWNENPASHPQLLYVHI